MNEIKDSYFSRGNIDAIRHCIQCGRALDVGVQCDCMDPPMTRATCPRFRCRASYRSKNYIECGSKLRFETREARNNWYEEHCCRGGEGCERCGS